MTSEETTRMPLLELEIYYGKNNRDRKWGWPLRVINQYATLTISTHTPRHLWVVTERVYACPGCHFVDSPSQSQAKRKNCNWKIKSTKNEFKSLMLITEGRCSTWGLKGRIRSNNKNTETLDLYAGSCKLVTFKDEFVLLCYTYFIEISSNQQYIFLYIERW